MALFVIPQLDHAREQQNDEIDDLATVTYDQLPEWLRDNAFIRTSNRPQLTWSQCCRSLFRLHSETFNVWSHLVAAVIFSFFEIADWFSSTRESALMVFRLGGVFCFSASAVFHLYYCYSENVNYRLAKLDYLGIISFMATGGHTYITLATGLDADTREKYTTVGAVVSATIVGLVLFMQNFGKPSMRGYRALMFLFFGAVVIIPIGHIYCLGQCHFCFPNQLIGVIFCLGVGLSLYATRFPECLWQNRFIDIWCASHFLFHTLVAVGSLLFYQVLKDMAKGHFRISKF